MAKGLSLSDWDAAGGLTHADVERLVDDELMPAGWQATVVLGLPPRKEAVSVRLDTDVLAWFRAQGPGYQTRINAVLRGFVDAKQKA
jgi:uncharacterized protein (DUF4415 family)